MPRVWVLLGLVGSHSRPKHGLHIDEALALAYCRPGPVPPVSALAKTRIMSFAEFERWCGDYQGDGSRALALATSRRLYQACASSTESSPSPQWCEARSTRNPAAATNQVIEQRKRNRPSGSSAIPCRSTRLLRPDPIPEHWKRNSQ